jgi:hypothetical protein
LDRRSGIGRLALGALLLLAALGPLGASERSGVATVVLASPDPQSSSELATGSAAEVGGTEGEGLRVRAEPALSGGVRVVLTDGTRVQVLEGPVSADGFRWYRVGYGADGATGWVAGQYLAAARTPAGASGALAALPTAIPASAPPTAPGAVTVPPDLGVTNDGATGEGPPATAGENPPPAAVSLPAPPSAAVPPPAPAAPAAAGQPGRITTTPGRYARLGGYQSASPEYGLNVFIWGEPATTQRDIDRIRELGFSWQKTLFQWRAIEGQRKGVFDWREADRVVQASTQANVKIIARIDFQPDWSRARHAHNGPPDKYEDYADFIQAFTTRYGTGSPIGRVHAIEIWNEPNLAREWGNAPVNEAQAADYVRLLRLSYEAAKSVDPNMVIITAGLTPTGTQNDEARPDDVYLQWMYDAGAAAWFDVLGAHGAGYRAPPQMSPEEVAADQSYGGHPSFAFRRVEHLRQVMERNGDGGKQVWLLEFGWTSDEVNPAYAWHRVSEEQKAQYIVDAYRWANQNWAPWIGVMTLWNLSAPGWSRRNEEYWWSISEPDGRPRLAYTRLLEARRSGQLP